MILLLLAQAAAVPADIQLDLRATARDVRIERSGETSLSVRAEPDAGSDVQVEKPETEGRRRLRNVTVAVRAEARIAGPRSGSNEQETEPPQ